MITELLKQLSQKTVKEYTVKPEASGLSSVKEEKYYPSIYFDSKTLPDIKSWEVGEEYCVMLVVRQMSKSMNESKGGVQVDARFDILKVAAAEMPEKSEQKTDQSDNLKKIYGV